MAKRIRDPAKMQYYRQTWKTRNPEKLLANLRARRAKNPAHHAALNRKRLYGCEADRPQPEFCELNCGRRCTDFDHDHATGLFRGWLCGPCNKAIGLLLDNAALVRRVADYIAFGGL